jgi:hypothetical protein
MVPSNTSSKAVWQKIQTEAIHPARSFIARELAARGVPTACGGAWSAVQVSDILRRGA